MVSAVDRALAWRARAALEAGPGGQDSAESVLGPDVGDSAPAAPEPEPQDHNLAAPAPAHPTPQLLESLRHHLLAGETHYPDRPGMVELRRLVGAALPSIGYPARGADGVLVTASEGESLFVTLLGLGAANGARFTGSAPARHQRLFDWMGLVSAGGGGEEGMAAAFHYRDARDGGRTASGTATAARADDRPDAAVPSVHAVAGQLFAPALGPDDRSGEGPPTAIPPDPPAATSTDPPAGDRLEHAIVIGSLDGLEGMRPFRLGFVAAPPKTLAGITKWKQASSICSPAPSQRAALWALGARP